MVNKLIAYLGFAQKSGKLVFGVDNIEAKENKIAVAIFDNTLSDNSYNKLCNIARRSNIMLLQSPVSIDELLNKNNCKAIGIASRDLAKAIIELNLLKEVQI